MFPEAFLALQYIIKETTELVEVSTKIIFSTKAAP
jgi:hypothetical protein